MKKKALVVILWAGLIIAESGKGDYSHLLSPIPLSAAGIITVTSRDGTCVEKIIADSKRLYEIPASGGKFRFSLDGKQIQFETLMGQHSLIVKMPYRGVSVPAVLQPPTMIEGAFRFIITQGFSLTSFSTRGSPSYSLDLEKTESRRGTFEKPTLSPRGTGIVAPYNPEDPNESPRILFLNAHLNRVRKDLVLDERYAGAKLTSFYSDPANGQMYTGVWGPGRTPSILCLSQDGVSLWEAPIGSVDDEESLMGRIVSPASYGEDSLISLVPRPSSEGTLSYYVFVLGVDGKAKQPKKAVSPPIEAPKADPGLR